MDKNIKRQAKRKTPTWNAQVAHFQVSLELFQARTRRLELGVRNPDLTRATSRATLVEPRQHVRVAVDVTEIELDTPSESHPTVACSNEQYRLVLTARRTEHLRLAVFSASLGDRRLCRKYQGTPVYQYCGALWCSE